MPIRLLDTDSAAKIAAGEVVERPASVAKELIENAIDAGASDIRVEFKDGGLSLLRVVDDGCGIPAAELALAFERHATSKIGSIDDLATVATLGFRGEALPSIAAVAQVHFASRAEGTASGSHIRVHGGEVVEQAVAGCPAGTSVSVRELFFNTPARRKFLKTPLAEGGQVTRLVGQFALAYPGIRFSLVSDGRGVFQSSGRGDLLDVIARLYGPEIARGMLPVELTGAEPSPHGRWQPDTASLIIRGYVSQPSLSRSSRAQLSLFVNGRLIQGRGLLHAVEEAYASLLMVGRHPLAVLHLSLDPALLDVNVHPAKAEVKFANERAVAARLHQAVHAAVARYAPVPVIDVRGPLVGQVPGRLPPWLASASGGLPDWAGSVDPLPEWAGGPSTATPPSAENVQSGGPTWLGAQDGGATGWSANAAGPPAAGARWVSDSNGAPRSFSESSGAEAWGRFAVPPAGAQPSVGHGAGMLVTLPMLRVLGQLALTYIIAEGPGGLYLVDQHAAHERVRLDELQRARANDTGQTPDAQLLLQPLTIEVTPAQAAVAAAAQAALSRLGLVLEAFGERTLLLRSVPAALPLAQARETVAAMLDELAAEASGGDWDDAAVHSLACHTAVRAGHKLSDEEMAALIAQLERCWSPQACAHGRPTMVHLSQAQLEREFGRR
ncbi:MAG: DNA mismatch repair endonuclease MutL [Chloroflexi bacterium]|nr:DNA mismatch repair endonuclease MutL [Chloroflexota bacterium]